MNIKLLTIGVSALLTMSVVTMPVKAGMATGEIMANTCYSCHGTDGISAGAMPTIAGKSEKFIAKNMKDFRNDKRKGTVMNRIAKGFSEAEIDALSKTFGK